MQKNSYALIFSYYSCDGIQQQQSDVGNVPLASFSLCSWLWSKKWVQLPLAQKSKHG